MILYYNGVDITQRVGITAAVGHDLSGSCADHAELEFENTDLWLSWNPKTDDVIEIVNGDYSSGEMYIAAMYPQEDKFKIMATAIPSGARRKTWMSYRNMTLDNIALSCAKESGMEHKLFGVGNYLYPYLLRENEGCAAFLERIARMEGAVLKCWNGRYTMIGIEAAQKLNADQTIQTDSGMRGIEYVKNDNARVRKLTVITPYARYTAEDLGADGDIEIIRTDVPAINDAQAARWARGLLLAHNRKAETLTVRGVFNERQTAMVRTDVLGDNDIGGAWIVDEVEHDHIGNSSTATLVRCIDTVI